MAYNEGFWQKAYLIEFLQGEIVKDAFTFSYPPQSEEFSFPQRINETKTFGGTVFDDYGNDTVSISLSGTTVNQAIKTIYCSEKGKKYLSGEDEIFYLQALIKKYGEIDNLKSKKVRLYELKSGSKSVSTKWWEGRIKDFTIKRSKDAPMTYFYSLNFVGSPTNTIQKKRPEWLHWLDDVEEWIDNLLEKLDKGLEPLEAVLQGYSEALDIITTIRKGIKDVSDKLQQYVDSVLEFGGVTSTYINETGLLINDITSAIDQSTTQVIRHTLSTGESIFNSVKEVNKSAKKFWKYFKDFDIKDITADILQEYNSTALEIKQAWVEKAKETEDTTDELVKLAKVLNDKKRPVVVPGTQGENDKIVTTYGYKIKQIKKGDNWDKLALEYYGDATKGSLLASYNASYNKDIENIEDIPAGEYIYIPVLSEQEIKENENLIFVSPNQKDVYGCDIDITDGDLELKNGDYVFVGNKENLAQAINNRLSVVVGSKIRDEVYGIRTNVGGIPEASSFILASIESTLLEEPRIQSIENIDFKTENGQLYVNIEYTDINDNVNKFNTVI